MADDNAFEGTNCPIEVPKIPDLNIIQNCGVPEAPSTIDDCPPPDPTELVNEIAPCPDFSGSVDVALLPPGSPPTSSLEVIETGSSESACAIDFNFEFEIPCADITIDGSVTVGEAVSGDPSATLNITRNAVGCDFDFDFDFDFLIPCPGVDFTGSVAMTSGGAASLVINKTPDEDECAYDFDFAFTIPCPNLTITATASATGAGGGSPSADVTVSETGTNCDPNFDFDFNFQIPTPTGQNGIYLAVLFAPLSCDKSCEEVPGELIEPDPGLDVDICSDYFNGWLPEGAQVVLVKSNTGVFYAVGGGVEVAKAILIADLAANGNAQAEMVNGGDAITVYSTGASFESGETIEVVWNEEECRWEAQDRTSPAPFLTGILYSDLPEDSQASVLVDKVPGSTVPALVTVHERFGCAKKGERIGLAYNYGMLRYEGIVQKCPGSCTDVIGGSGACGNQTCVYIGVSNGMGGIVWALDQDCQDLENCFCPPSVFLPRNPHFEGETYPVTCGQNLSDPEEGGGE